MYCESKRNFQGKEKTIFIFSDETFKAKVSYPSPISGIIVDLKKNMQSDILCFSMFADGTNLEHGPYI